MPAPKYEYGIISRLATSRRTLLSQLKEQGYDVSSYENFSINEVNIMVQNKQQDMIVKHKNTGNKMYVSYYVEKGLRPQNVHDMIDDLFNLEKMLTTADILTVVVKDAPNDTLVNLLLNIYANENIFINVLYLDQLQFNVLEHSLVPLHTKMTKTESDDMKKKYNITSEEQMPQISRFDPPAQAIGLRPGDVCHIVRPSKTSVTLDNYRVCVNKARSR
jgi:DNA-directed RNA polymerase subunit H (RpoH/RPB5)